MATVSWRKSLMRGGFPRRTYQAWLIPEEIRLAYGIMDQDYIQVKIHTSPEAVTSSFKVSSGGELQVGRDVAKQLEEFASNSHATELGFSFDSYLVVNDPAPNGRETTRLALIAARLGQGEFRRSLEQRYKYSCAITGISQRDLLRASHIKPWAVSDNSEKLDVDNGLLLVANLDAAFDAKLITFGDDGTMIGTKSSLQIVLRSIGSKAQTLKLKIAPSPKQKKFLQYHRAACKLNDG